MTDRDKLWRHLETSLTALAESVSAGVDTQNLELVRDFIENREYGVALEWLYSVLVERRVQLSEQQSAEIERLAQLMEIDLGAIGRGE